MSAANDKAGLQEAGWLSLVEERDRIARQAENLGEAMRLMRDVRNQMQDRFIAIMGELQRRATLSADTHDGDAK